MTTSSVAGEEGEEGEPSNIVCVCPYCKTSYEFSVNCDCLDNQDEDEEDEGVMRFSAGPSPVFEPRSPVFEPRSPVFEPRSPVFEPRSPVFEPRSPVFEPRSPVFEPRSPVVDGHSGIHVDEIRAALHHRADVCHFFPNAGGNFILHTPRTCPICRYL